MHERQCLSRARGARSRGVLHTRAMANRCTPRVPPLTDAERARLMAEIRRHGEQRAAGRMGLARQTVARALARLPLMAGSTLLIRTALAALPVESAAPTPPQAA